MLNIMITTARNNIKSIDFWQNLRIGIIIFACNIAAVEIHIAK